MAQTDPITVRLADLPAVSSVLTRAKTLAELVLETFDPDGDVRADLEDLVASARFLLDGLDAPVDVVETEPEGTRPADLEELEADGVDFAADDDERLAAHRAAAEAGVAGNDDEVDDEALFAPEVGGEG